MFDCNNLGKICEIMVFFCRTLSIVTLLKVFDCNNSERIAKMMVFFCGTLSIVTSLKVCDCNNLGKIYKTMVFFCRAFNENFHKSNVSGLEMYAKDQYFVGTST